MPKSTAKQAERSGTGSPRAKEADLDAGQLRRLLAALDAMRDGNFRKRLPVSGDGLAAELAIAYNEIAERQQHILSELTRVRRVAGREGGTASGCSPGSARAAGPAASTPPTAWSTDLVRPDRRVRPRGGGGVRRRPHPADGPAARRPAPARGAAAASPAASTGWSTSCPRSPTRSPGSPARSAPRASSAARRGYASADGSWRDLIDAVNTMSSRLTAQVRDIALVTTAVADGDLSRTVTVEVSGEMAQLKDTVDRMVDQLSSFAAEVTRVAREVGTEGRLGGQADVRGVSGHLEGPHRLGQHDGVQPDQPGPWHLLGRAGRRARRPEPADHGHRARRGRRARRDAQLDDRDPADVRRRGHPGGPRGGHRGHPRRPGGRARRGRHAGRTSPSR